VNNYLIYSDCPLNLVEESAARIRANDAKPQNQAKSGEVLRQTRCSQKCEHLQVVEKMERETGTEPATSSLGSWHSTAELLPLILNTLFFYVLAHLVFLISATVQQNSRIFIAVCGTALDCTSA
jgi:hypothetical protein